MAGLLRYRALLLAVVAVISGLAGVSAGWMRFQNSIEIWFLEGDPELEVYREFRERFQADEIAMVGVFADDVFDPDVLARIDRITRGAWGAPYVSRVRSLADVQTFFDRSGDLVIRQLMEDFPGVRIVMSGAPSFNEAFRTYSARDARPQAFLPLLRRSRGRIVFMSSVSARVATPFLGAYAASKFALEAIVDALRIELDPWGIQVVSVQPGPVATPIWGKSVAASDALASQLGSAADLYGSRMAAVRESAERAGRESGVAPEAVAEVVFRALTARRPRTRYLVGPYTRALALLLGLAPDRVRDWAIRATRFRGADS